jgi:dihydroorotate dehydrogenase
MQFPYEWARPWLFSMEPEQAHAFTFQWADRLERLGLLKHLVASVPDFPVKVMGIEFPNPVGLSAGLDKNAEHLDALARLGFGFLEVGTITPKPQPGNPQPRMFRIPEKQALINRLGFNNEGVPALIRNVQRSRYVGVLGINIGKNAATPVERAQDDYVSALRDVYAYATYVTVNISSPNTKNLRDLQGGDALDTLLQALKDERENLCDEHGVRRPLALKIAPDLDDDQIDAIADRLMTYGFDAVIATNTTITRDAVKGLPHADEAGGLSGAPVADLSLRVIARLKQRVGRDMPIIGVGGIMTGADARAKMDAGASLVQIYTGLIYRGPALIGECVDAMRLTLKEIKALYSKR